MKQIVAARPRLTRDLRAIDATPARWRGREGLSPLDAASTRSRRERTHWLICAQVVELKFLDARGAFDKKGHGDVPIWAMMSEDILTLDGLADASIPTDGYVDDGEAH